MAEERTRQLREEVLQGIQELLEPSRIIGLCANCNMPMTHDSHVCDPDQTSELMVSRAWRQFLGPGPQRRAKGYAVT